MHLHHLAHKYPLSQSISLTFKWSHSTRTPWKILMISISHLTRRNTTVGLSMPAVMHQLCQRLKTPRGTELLEGPMSRPKLSPLIWKCLQYHINVSFAEKPMTRDRLYVATWGDISTVHGRDWSLLQIGRCSIWTSPLGMRMVKFELMVCTAFCLIPKTQLHLKICQIFVFVVLICTSCWSYL